MFALGVILVNFLTGSYPFDSVFERKSEKITDEFVKFAEDPSIFLKNEDPTLIDLIKRMVAFDLEDRLSIKEVLSHPWCNSRDVARLEQA